MASISNAFPTDRVARGVAIRTEYEKPDVTTPTGRPIKIFIVGLAESSKTVSAAPYDFVSLADTASVFGYGSTMYQVAKALRPPTGVGAGVPITFFPMAVTAGGASAGDITPVGTVAGPERYVIKINNKPSLNIDMVKDETVADFIAKAISAVNGVIDSYMTASDGTTTLDLTSKVHTAEAGNQYYIEVESPANASLSFTITQPTGGAGTVDYETAWAVWNDTWYSHNINAVSDVTDDTYLDSAEAFGELRWSPEVHKPAKFYTGTNDATLATVTAITDLRKEDRNNIIDHSPGSNDLPWIIVSDKVKEKVIRAASFPAWDYTLLTCSALTPGPAANQLDSTAREATVEKGLSTIEVLDETVKISDSVTCYHPDGEEPPGFRYDVDIEKQCYMLYNISLIFNDPALAGRPLVPDGQAAGPNVLKPSFFKRKLFTLYDGAAIPGVISDPEYAKEKTIVQISGTNPKELDVLAVYKLGGNYNIGDITTKFSFFLGG